MQARKNLEQLAQEITRQKEASRDFIAPAKKLTMVLDEERRPALEIPEQGAFPLGRYAGGQIAQKFEIPQRYYDRMAEEIPELLTLNVNGWMKKSDTAHMVRTLDGNARAFLSNKYRTIDNWLVAEGVLTALQASGLEIVVKSCEITERRMYIQVVTPEVQAEIRQGEYIQAGFTVSNSEIGQGSASFTSLVYYLACSNGQKCSRAFNKNHVGRRIGNQDGADVFEFSDRTRELDDAAYMSALKDMTARAISDMSLNDEVLKIQKAMGRELPASRIQETVQEVSKSLGFSEVQSKGILGRLIKGGELSQYGLASAVTNLANSQEEVPNYDDVIELQKRGAELMYMSETDWDILNKNAEQARASA